MPTHTPDSPSVEHVTKPIAALFTSAFRVAKDMAASPDPGAAPLRAEVRIMTLSPSECRMLSVDLVQFNESVTGEDGAAICPPDRVIMCLAEIFSIALAAAARRDAGQPHQQLIDAIADNPMMSAMVVAAGLSSNGLTPTPSGAAGRTITELVDSGAGGGGGA
jgi:hypothetical protein